MNRILWRCTALVHVMLSVIHASRAQFIDNDVVGERLLEALVLLWNVVLQARLMYNACRMR